jgi:hypothetical protein
MIVEVGTDIALTPQNTSVMNNLDLANYDFTFNPSRYMLNFDILLQVMRLELGIYHETFLGDSISGRA